MQRLLSLLSHKVLIFVAERWEGVDSRYHVSCERLARLHKPSSIPSDHIKRIQLPLKRTITKRILLSGFGVGGFVCLVSQGKCLSPPTEYLLMRRHRIYSVHF